MVVHQAEESHLKSYVRLLVDLHRLVANDQADSDQADELRDQMDPHWYKLADVEVRLANVLGTDLNSFDQGRQEQLFNEDVIIGLCLLNGAGLKVAPETAMLQEALDKRFSRLDGSQQARLKGLLADLSSIGVNRRKTPTASKQGAREFQDATNQHEWDLALSILREHENQIAPAEIAAMRGVCWAQLGNHEIASLFFGEAVRQNPSNIELEICYLRSLISGGRHDDAQRKANFLANRETDPRRLMLAADILFDAVVGGKGKPGSDDFKRIIGLVDRAALDPSSASSDSFLRQIACSAYLAAALCFEHLNDKLRADTMYRIAHRFYDNHLTAETTSSRNRHDLPFSEVVQRERNELQRCFSSPRYSPAVN